MARQQEVEVNTRLGRRLISMDKVIHFPRGLAGFEGEHEFTLLQIRPEAPLLLLQSMQNPSLGLVVADPYMFLPNYSVTVGDAEQKLLRLKSVRQVAVLVTVSIPPGKPELTTLNLTGPVLINHKKRIGLQVPQTENNGPARIYLQPGPDGSPRAVEDPGLPSPAAQK
jgi:flagellar assembly factor FliW